MDNNNKLKIVSYDCNSAKNRVDVIRELINNHDIVCLQETFLNKSDTDFIMGLDKNINFFISDSQVNYNANGGHPKGGLLIIWKKYLDKAISPILFHTNYIGISSADNDYLLVNVYLPYDDHSNDQLTNYRQNSNFPSR